MYIKSRSFAMISFILVSIVFLPLLAGCEEPPMTTEEWIEMAVEAHTPNFDEEEIDFSEFRYNPELTWDRDMQYYVGTRIRALDDIPGIDEPVILVNGQPITRRNVEVIKIWGMMQNSFSLREGINAFIRDKVAILEAARLGIEPSQDAIEAYMRDITENFEEGLGDFVEMMLSHLDGLRITLDEYFVQLEIMAYDSFLLDELWFYIEPQGRYPNWEAYVDSLVSRASIQFLDEELSVLFRGF